MVGLALPDDVQALLRERIESFEQLEILLLCRQHHDQTWTSESIATKLHIGSALAGEALKHLCRGNLLGAESLVFRYRPGTPELDQAVKNLSQACNDRRIEVMSVLSANAVDRVRTSAVRMFADAFLIGKRKKDG